jgi:mono/diheme cytochrome c family protein
MRTNTVVQFVVGLCVAAVATARGQQPATAAPEKITPAMIALGDSIFHGQAGGGMCFGCHGPEGKGVPSVAPDLTAGKWLHGDGSYASIAAIVTSGVPKPKVAASPMPPMGGSQLNEAQIRAVAAYVYSLTHPGARTSP